MEPGAVVEAAVQLLKSFKPAVDTVDSHVQSALGDYDESVEGDRVLLQQVFYGCQRFKRVLRVLMSALFFNYGSSLNRGDFHMLSVLSYLLLFRLDEMGWARVKPLLESQPLNRVHILINFLLDDEATGTWLVEDWSALLDRSYVQETMLGALKRAQPAVGQWLKATHARAFGAEGGADLGKAKPAASSSTEQPSELVVSGASGAAPVSSSSSPASGASSSKHAKKPPTVPRSPRITKPRPRLLPEPMRMEQAVRARPIPQWLNKTTLSGLKAQQEERARRRREAAEERLKLAQAPQLHATRNTVDKVRAEVEAQREAELQFEGQPARPPPPLPQTGADVRLNAAAVLREDFLLRARQEKEAAIVKRFESELRDEAEFRSWQARMRAQDEEAKVAAVEQRRQLMAQSAAAAKRAVDRELQGKRRVAVKMRERRQLTGELLGQQRAASREAKRRVLEEVRAVRETKPREAEQRVLEENRVRAEAVRAERVAAEAALQKEKEEEAEAVADRTRRLRAEAEVKAPRVQPLFDPTTTAGHGFLGEMSMLEARERLAMEQARQEEEVEQRRREIMTRRREEQLQLEEKMHSIARTRASAANVARHARERRQTARAAAEEEAARTLAESTMRLDEKLRQKKEARDAERRALEEESRKIAKRNLFLGAAKSAIEQRRHEQLRLNREAAAVRAASREREEHKARTRSRALDAAERGRSRAANTLERRRVRAAANEALRTGKVEAEAVRAGDRAARREAFFTATAREERLALQRAGDNVYATTVKEDAADAARRRRGGPDREEAHEGVLQARLARMTAEQAEATGMAATMRRRRTAKQALRSKMDATRRETMRVSQQLASGLGAARAKDQTAAATGRRGKEHWRHDGADTLGRTLEEELRVTVESEAKRVGPALRERRSVLTATTSEAQGWQALQR